MENLLSAVPPTGATRCAARWRGPPLLAEDEEAAAARAPGLLKRFGLTRTPNSYAGDLSGGQRRMVEIMRALMAEPRVCCSTSRWPACTPALARRIGVRARRARRRGLTVLMVEHELAIMDEFCDPVIAMAEGTCWPRARWRSCAAARGRGGLPCRMSPWGARARTALRATGVTAGYGGDPVIQRTSRSRAEPGQVVSLVGPNGSGKSTLLKSLVGVVSVAGTVIVGEPDMTGWPPEEVARAGVGYVPQVDDVFAPLTVRENLEMGGYLLPPARWGRGSREVLAVFPRLAGDAGAARGQAERRRAEDAGHGPGADARAGASSCSTSRPPTSRRRSPRTLLEDTSAGWPRAARRCWSSSSAPGRCSPSPTTPTSSRGGEVRMEGTPAELAASPAFIESFLGGTVPR